MVLTGIPGREFLNIIKRQIVLGLSSEGSIFCHKSPNPGFFGHLHSCSTVEGAATASVLTDSLGTKLRRGNKRTAMIKFFIG